MKEENQKTIKDVLAEPLGLKGLNIEKLAQLTDIPKNYLRAILEGDNQNLPAAPYVRGYLIRIAEIIDMDGDYLWQIYKKSLDLKTSGEEDKMPSNRFVIKRFGKKKFILAVLAVFVIIYLAFQIEKFLGVPSVEINNPATDNIIVNSSAIDLRGKINPRDKLTINNEETTIDKDGYFIKQFSLEPGINTVEFKVKRLLGKEIKVVRQVIYQQQ